MKNKSIAILILCGFLGISVGTNLVFFSRMNNMKKELKFFDVLFKILSDEARKQNEEDFRKNLL